MTQITASTFLSALLFCSLCGCDIFLDDIGHQGEPCSAEGTCIEGLVCNFDVCTSPAASGEPCKPFSDSSPNPCIQPAVCIYGTCGNIGELGTPCLHDYARDELYCFEDLECVNEVCKNYGDKGEPCIPPPGREPVCDGNPDCQYDPCHDADYRPVCVKGICVDYGEEGEPCVPSNKGYEWCFSPWSCIAGICSN